MTIKERNELITNYIPLANKLAFQKNKFVSKNITFEELKSAAYMGLVDAAIRFDNKRNCSFFSYAKIRISGEICDFIRKNKTCIYLEDTYAYNY
jgi:RNA polymerase sigma factor for flagellar operon FliA